jgi:hypothetical protein
VISRAFALWSAPAGDAGRAIEAFAGRYRDPVRVDGTATALSDFVGRAQQLLGALDDVRHEIHEQVEAPGRLAFAFRLTARHTGPLVLGDVVHEPTGTEITVQGMDIFLVDEEGLVTDVWALNDLATVLAAVR